MQQRSRNSTVLTARTNSSPASPSSPVLTPATDASSKKKDKKDHHKKLGTKKDWAGGMFGTAVSGELQLIGGEEQMWSSGSEEVQEYRRALAATRNLVDFEVTQRVYPVYLSQDPLPPKFPEKILARVSVRLPDYLKDGQKVWITTIQLISNSTFRESTELVLEKIKSQMAVAENSLRVEDIIFKASTAAIYLYGDAKVSDHEYVRDCIRKEMQFLLVDVVEMRTVTNYACEFDKKTLYQYEDPIQKFDFKELSMFQQQQQTSSNLAQRRALLVSSLPHFLWEDEDEESEGGLLVMEKIFTKLYFKVPALSSLEWSTTVHVETGSTVREFMTDVIFEQLKKQLGEPCLAKVKPSDFMIRVTGAPEYIFYSDNPDGSDDRKLSDFRAIRRIMTGATLTPKIELDIVEIESVAKASLFGITQNASDEVSTPQPQSSTEKEDKMAKILKYKQRARVTASSSGNVDSSSVASANPSANTSPGVITIPSWDINHASLSFYLGSMMLHRRNTTPVDQTASQTPDKSEPTTPTSATPAQSASTDSNSTKVPGQYLFVRAAVYFGDKMIGEHEVTSSIACWDMNSNCATWNELLAFNSLPISDLPEAARINIIVYRTSTPPAPIITALADVAIIGWVNCYIFGRAGMFNQGKRSGRLWLDDPAPYKSCCTDNIQDALSYAIDITLPSFIATIQYTNGRTVPYSKRMPGALLNEIVSKDSLYTLTEGEKFLVWNCRDYLKTIPGALSKFLQSVDWGNPTAVCETYRVMKDFVPLDPLLAMELLDVEYPDPRVREYAVSRLELLSDSDVALIMLQLVECLKHEPFHVSPLSCFLLRRAVGSPHIVGHTLFWCLKAEMHNSLYRERFALLLQEYLKTAPVHAEELRKQCIVVDLLWDVALKIKKTPKSENVQQVLQRLLKEEVIPRLPMDNGVPRFSLPLSAKFDVSGIVVEKCKVMSSAKMPLMLAFQNANDAAPDPLIWVIFKAGDDLKQDILTLQILKYMDNVWKRAGLDLRMIPYGCMATAEGVGFIEVVVNSKTMADITASQGTFAGALSSVNKNDETLLNWLKQHNKNEAELTKAIDRFVNSCAGYFVATYVLGIGDRHSDNIMITKNGNLFHIDFGHFLGHFKKVEYLNIKRETSPFVFTPMYGMVLGGVDSENYKKLERLAGEAYNLLRKNAGPLLILFKMMRFNGIPELQSVKDIEFLQQKLYPHLSDSEAADQFSRLMLEALTNLRQVLSDLGHYVKHKALH